MEVIGLGKIEDNEIAEWLHFFSDDYELPVTTSLYIPGAYFGRAIMTSDGRIKSINYKRDSSVLIEYFPGYIQCWQLWSRIK